MFLGRDRELYELNKLFSQDKFQLFVLYGRRRVGKTTLLKEFCKDKNHIFFSAEQTNNKMNLEKFSALILQHYDETFLESFSSWDNAFSFIHHRQQEQSLVLVLDEFPYLAECNRGILSMLQHLIDHTLQYGKIFLILCGSYMGFMEKEVLGGKSPLFGRRTAQLHMKPFSYKDSIQFLSGFSPEEKLLLYGAMGGTAMYLRQVINAKSIKDNIQDLFLTPTGYLYEEPLLLLRQEVQEPGVYCAIIEAIANGASRAAEIATKTGEDSAKCLKYIASLKELGIIYKEVPFGEKETSRKTIYRISDLMFRFWYRYVAPNKTLLETGSQEIVWKRRIEPDLNNYMGLVFEKICRDYLLYKNSRGELPLLFTHIGRWWGTDPLKKIQVEIDLIAQDNEDYLFAECKWRNEPMGISALHELYEKADIFLKNRKNSWFALFSKSGFTTGLMDEAFKEGNVILVSLDDIMVQEK